MQVEVEAKSKAPLPVYDSSGVSSDDEALRAGGSKGRGGSKAKEGSNGRGGGRGRGGGCGSGGGGASRGGSREGGVRGGAPEEAEAGEKDRVAKRLDVKGIHNAVLKLHEATELHSGERLFTVSHLADWDRFMAETPTSLAEIAPDERMKLELFPPFTATAAPVGRPAREQIEIMPWNDFQETARGVSDAVLERERREVKMLTTADVNIGDVAVLKAQGTDAYSELPRLPMWIGRVDSLSTAAKTVTLHWHFPFASSQPSADVNARWLPLCVGGHEWTSRCNFGHCGGRKAECPTTKWMSDVDIETLVLANQKLLGTGHLSAKLQKELVRSAEALGLTIVLDATTKKHTLDVRERCQPCT